MNGSEPISGGRSEEPIDAPDIMTPGDRAAMTPEELLIARDEEHLSDELDQQALIPPSESQIAAIERERLRPKYYKIEITHKKVNFYRNIEATSVEEATKLFLAHMKPWLDDNQDDVPWSEKIELLVNELTITELESRPESFWKKLPNGSIVRVPKVDRPKW